MEKLLEKTTVRTSEGEYSVLILLVDDEKYIVVEVLNDIELERSTPYYELTGAHWLRDLLLAKIY